MVREDLGKCSVLLVIWKLKSVSFTQVTKLCSGGLEYDVHISKMCTSVWTSLTTAAKTARLGIRRRNWFANLRAQFVEVVLRFQAERMVFTKLGAVH